MPTRYEQEFPSWDELVAGSAKPARNRRVASSQGYDRRLRPRDWELLAIVVVLAATVVMVCVGNWAFEYPSTARQWFSVLGSIVLWPAAAITYVTPYLVARARKSRYREAILALNILLGWTFIGWVVALVWALIPAAAQPQATASAPGLQAELERARLALESERLRLQRADGPGRSTGKADSDADAFTAWRARQRASERN